ncbi:recombinase family protein [Fuchsiella alkaliacetigena]|nr:recombinase family protein [Fuchsiella alkaliacetigena]
MSINAQLEQLHKYAQQNNYQILKEYIDSGQSAKDDQRPQFQEMIQEIKNNPDNYEAVLIHKIDRFARNRKDSVLYKSLLRKKCEVDVISITENFGKDAIGKMVEGILESVAEFYSENLAQEVKKGQLQRAKRGQALGKPPLGYKINSQTGKYEIQVEEAKVVKYIFNEYIIGKGSKEISQNLKSGLTDLGKAAFKKSTGEIMKWSNVTILKILKNKAYIGTFNWQEISIENNHPALIDQEDFELVQKLISQRKKRHHSQTKPGYLLQGFLKCYECGGSLSRQIIRQKDKRYNYTRCITNQKERSCYTNMHRIEKVESVFLKNLTKIIIASKFPKKIKQANSSLLKKEQQKLKSKLDSLDKRFQRQMKAYEKDIINLTELSEAKERLNKEQEALTTKFEKIKQKLEQENRKEKLSNLEARELCRVLLKEQLPLSKRQAKLNKIIKELRLSKKKELIEIIYKG